MAAPTPAQWAATRVLVSSDPLLSPPTAEDCDLVVACGGVVDHTVAGAA